MRNKLKESVAWMGRIWDKIAGPKGDRNLLGALGGFVAGTIKFPFKFTWWTLKASKSVFVSPKGAVEEIKYQGYRLMRAAMAGMGISKGPRGLRVDDRGIFLGYAWMISVVLAPIGVIFGEVVVAIMCLWAPACWLIMGIRPFFQTWRLVKREQYVAARAAVDLQVMHHNLEDLWAAPEKLAILKARIEADAPAAKAALTRMRSGSMAYEVRETKAIVQDVGEAERVIGTQLEDTMKMDAIKCPNDRAQADLWIELHESFVEYPFIMDEDSTEDLERVTNYLRLNKLLGSGVARPVFDAYKNAGSKVRQEHLCQAAKNAYAVKYGGEVVI